MSEQYTVGGVVITLSADPSLRAMGLAGLAQLAHLTTGELQGARLPAVIESHSPREGRAHFEALAELPGVDMVELAYVHFDEVSQPEADDQGRADEASSPNSIGDAR